MVDVHILGNRERVREPPSLLLKRRKFTVIVNLHRKFKRLRRPSGQISYSKEIEMFRPAIRLAVERKIFSTVVPRCDGRKVCPAVLSNEGPQVESHRWTR